MAFFVTLLVGIVWTTVGISRRGLKGLSWAMWLVTMLGLVGTIKWISGGL